MNKLKISKYKLIVINIIVASINNNNKKHYFVILKLETFSSFYFYGKEHRKLGVLHIHKCLERHKGE